ncbi:MAG: hypothetical protein ACO3O0_08750 [Bacteroidia bacterium]
MAEKEGTESSVAKIAAKIKPNRKAAVFVLCLVISAVAWFAKALTGSFSTSYHIPIAYQNLPFNSRLGGDLPKEAVFHYQGSGWDLLYLHFRNIPDSITIDIGKDSIVDGKIRIRSLSLISQLPDDPLPFRIEPEWIAPGIISETSKKIPVIADLDIGYRNRFDSIRGATTVPDSIQISGPPDLLKAIQKIETVQFSRKDVFQNISEQVYLKKSLPKGVLQSHTQVELTVEVGEFTEGSFMVPVDFKGSEGAQPTLIPSKVKVVFQAELSRLGAIKPDDFSLQADTTFQNTGNPLPIQVIKKPAGVKRIRLEPDRVEYLYQP